VQILEIEEIMKKLLITGALLMITTLAIGQRAYVRVKSSNLYEKPDLNSEVQVVLHAGCEVSKIELISLRKEDKRKWVYVNAKLDGAGEYEGYLLKVHLILNKQAVNKGNYMYKATKSNPKAKRIFWSNPKKAVEHLKAAPKDNKPFVQRKFERDKKGIYYRNDRGKKVYIKQNR